MKKPSKTAAELEASIKVEMEDICDWPTDMMISVQPDGDSWKVTTMGIAMFRKVQRRVIFELSSSGSLQAHTSKSPNLGGEESP
jgi:hypothetical protein